MTTKARKATHARLATVLEAIPNVGVSIARDLRSIGIKQPQELIGRNPHSLYQALCDRTRTRQDPCVLDTFISAVPLVLLPNTSQVTRHPSLSLVLYRRAKKEISHLLTGRPQDCHGPPAKIISARDSTSDLRLSHSPRLPPQHVTRHLSHVTFQ